MSAFPFTRLHEEGVLDKAKKQPVVNEDVQAILVNHHLLADDLIARTFQTASSQMPDAIILVSPNHFQNGSKPFLTTSKNWQTSFGPVRSDSVHVQALATLQYFADDEGPFYTEHGVYNIMPFIAATYPGVPVIPIIVKDNVPIEVAREMAKMIDRRTLPNTLVIGSFDFSHYISESEAQEKDARSLKVLQALDSTKASEVTVDSQAGIALFLELSRLRGAGRFHLIDRDSSAQRFPSAAAEENTSYIVGFFSR
ncbi:MAG: AmmeMemoRadiSam system protein B [Candidatus Nomurabacteria bacterium]|nr:MAG: AmmeMemoRadiSam system protein B [Candidatus Nomurabacteria bacterium]